MTQVSTLAKALLDQHRSIEGAAEALVLVALQDPEVRDALTKDALRNAAFMAVRQASATQRNTAWKVAATVPLAASAKDWANAIGNGLLSTYRLTSGQLLQDATLEEVLETIRVLEEQASDMMDKAAWLRLVSQAVKPGKTVGESITEKQARTMHARVVKVAPASKSA